MELHADQPGLVRAHSVQMCLEPSLESRDRTPSLKLVRAPQSRVWVKRTGSKAKAVGRLIDTSWKKMLIVHIMNTGRQIRKGWVLILTQFLFIQCIYYTILNQKEGRCNAEFRWYYSLHSPGERCPNMGKAKEIPQCSRVRSMHMLSLESMRPACKGNRPSEKFLISVPLCSLSWRGPKLASQKNRRGRREVEGERSNREIDKKPILPPFFISHILASNWPELEVGKRFDVKSISHHWLINCPRF